MKRGVSGIRERQDGLGKDREEGAPERTGRQIEVATLVEAGQNARSCDPHYTCVSASDSHGQGALSV